MFAFLDGPEAIVVAVVLLLVFGANRVPKIARQLGQAQRELKKGIEEGFSGDKDDPATPDAATAATSPAAPSVDPVSAEQPPSVPVADGATAVGTVEPAVVPAPAEPTPLAGSTSFAPPLPPPQA